MKSPRHSWRSFAFPLAILATFAGSAFPPLTNRLGYESAILTNLVTYWLGVPLVLRMARADYEPGSERDVWRQYLLAVLRLVWIPLLSLAIGVLNASRVVVCDWGVGLEYWLIFGVGGVPFSAAIAVFCGAFRGARAIAVYGMIGVLSAASSLAFLYFQPPIVVYDLVHGYFAGSIYDESLVGTGLHWAYRGYTTAFALLVVSLLEAACAVEKAQARRLLANVTLASLTAAISLALFVRFDDQGLRITRGMIERELGEPIVTEHFEIYASDTGFDERQLRLLVADHEARYAQLADFWGVEPELPLRSYVYGSRKQKGELMGGRRTLVAKVWLGEMHIVWDEAGDDLLAHEMSHLFLREFGSGPLSLPAFLGLFPNMGMVEGSATAAAWGERSLTAHGWSAALLRLDMLPDIESSLSATRFWAQPSGIAYTAVGSFSRWLIESYGVESYLDAYRSGHFERAFGHSTGELVSRWKDMLRTLELEEADVSEAQLAFDRSSIFRAKCPRAAAGWMEQLQWAARRGDRQAVEELVDKLERDRLLAGERLLEGARALSDVESNERARLSLENALQEESLAPAGRQRARLLLSDIASRIGDREARDAWLDDMKADPMSEALSRAVFVRRETAVLPLNDQEPIREYLAGRNAETWPTLVGVSVHARRSPLSAYLTGLAIAGGELESVGAEVLEEASAAFAGTPLWNRTLRELAFHQSVHGNREACGTWSDLSLSTRSVSSYQAEATLWLNRCENGWWPFDELRLVPVRESSPTRPALDADPPGVE